MATLCRFSRLSPYYSGVVQQLTRLASVNSLRCMSGLSAQFEESKNRLSKLKNDPGNEAKLKIYALFKQSTIGTVNTKRPGMMDFVGRAKWDAWNALGSMSQEEAQKAYIDYINSLVAEEEEQQETQTTSSTQKYECLDVTVQDGLCVIKLNRPKKKNAITVQMYNEWSSALKEADEDPGVVITAVTGAGDFYCSGNDLSNFMNIPPEGMKQMAIDSGKLLNRFVSSFIDFKKPLIAVVNGPAVGVSVTIMALFDAVYATDKATFHTPFSALGQSPEGCSSYTFPRIMGTSKATELLLFNKKITAHEAEKIGFVSEVFPDSSFQQEVWPRLQALSKLPINSLIFSKALTRDMEKDVLHKVNDIECDRLVERWLSDDCAKAIMAFFSRKK
ncbi:enoyl-CoA delta isomerase 2-like isoform X2 [Oratosquilla oratoria]|uniref:enoyl-CoA delta isomerase 2-like isoform X2 n=1 Tax=Oratosquilla oratoria TaxID=337810 RepID=UPI003F771FAA